MSATTGSTPPGSVPPRARANYADPNTRVSDAERSEVADRLSRHYGDGRLDQEEFDRRLHQAMSAVTQGDLSGLFADLPGEQEPPPASTTTGRATADAPAGPAGAGPQAGPPLAPGWPGGHPAGRIGLKKAAALGVLIVLAAIVGHAIASMFLPWLLIAAVVVLWLRFEGPRRRHDSRPPADD